jgi:hypothetical protein
MELQTRVAQLLADKDKLEDTVAQLFEDKTTVERERDALQGQTKDLQAELQSLQASHATLQRSHSVLQQQSENDIATLASVREELRIERDESSQVETARTRWLERLQSMTHVDNPTDLTLLDNVIARALSEARDYEASTQALTAELESLKQENLAWKRAREVWLSEIHSLTKQAASAGSTDDAVQRKFADMQARLDALEEEAAQLRMETAAYAKAKDRWVQEKRALTQQVETSTASVAVTKQLQAATSAILLLKDLELQTRANIQSPSSPYLVSTTASSSSMFASPLAIPPSPIPMTFPFSPSLPGRPHVQPPLTPPPPNVRRTSSSNAFALDASTSAPDADEPPPPPPWYTQNNLSTPRRVGFLCVCVCVCVCVCCPVERFSHHCPLFRCLFSRCVGCLDSQRSSTDQRASCISGGRTHSRVCCCPATRATSSSCRHCPCVPHHCGCDCCCHCCFFSR